MPGFASTRDLDAETWTFRTTFEASPAAPGEEVVLRLDGVATLAEVELNGERLLDVESMFEAHEVDVGDRLRGTNELVIRCLPLTAALEVPRKPRARWRTNLVADGRLRWFRTMILGRAPGFAPGPPVVGPWRPVWLARRRGVALEALTLRTSLEGDDGSLRVDGRLRSLDGATPRSVQLELDGPSGRHTVALDVSGDGGGITFRGTLRVPSVERWWPHTHGAPALHDVRLLVDSGTATIAIDGGRVGFRTLTAGPTSAHDVERDGLDLHVNGVRIFARGALWTPTDIIGFGTSAAELRAALETVRAAGMNMLRLPGTGAYETNAFHDLCDELGILVWQDFMFANLDYPFADDAFRGLAEREATEVLARIAGRPSTTVLCGNSEIEQQVAMLGLDPALGRDPFFAATLPALATEAGTDAICVPSTPFGGDLPFRPDHGVANYYGVGGYRRPLTDARFAGVRFASECLAFANVPDDEVIESLLPGSPTGVVVHHPAWKAGVPRDVGTGWDFDDVRDHYLALLFDLDPVELRRVDHARYLELSRAVSGEVMAEVFGEWRRAGSPCGGGLVLWLRDLVAGAGWGLLDHRGEPKVAYHHLRRALAPAAVWTTDEGLGGVVAHVANDGPEPLDAHLRVALYRDQEQRVGEGEERLRLDSARGPRAQRRGPDRAFRGRVVGLSLRAARPGRHRGQPGPRWGAGRLPAVPGVPVPGRTAEERGIGRPARPLGAGPPVRRWPVPTDGRHAAARVRGAHPRARVRARRRRLLDRTGRVAPGRPASADTRCPVRWRAHGHQPRRSTAHLAGGRVMMRRAPARPLYLDLEAGPVFGVYHAVPVDATPSTAVLICPPWGWNDITSYRARRAWAEHLAETGRPTLRIDLPGTGDSGGVPADDGRLAAWSDAIAGAAAWLRDASGARRVTAIAMGLGGLVTLMSIGEGADIDDVVLWATPGSGRAFVRAERAFANLQTSRYSLTGDPEPTLLPDGWMEVNGFVLSADTVGALEALTLGGSAGGRLQRALLLDQDGVPVNPGLRAHLEGAGVEVTTAAGPGWGAMTFHPERFDPPLAVFAAVDAWLAAAPDATRSVPASSVTPVIARDEAFLEVDGVRVREAPFTVEHEVGTLFGVLAEPVDGPRPPLAAIFLNAGAVRRIGPNRLWVEAARQAAAAGLPTLRVDLEGIGDSDGDAGRYRDVGEFYRDELDAYIGAFLDALEARGYGDRFVLAGLCAGGFWAFNGADRDARAVAALMVNPGALEWHPELVKHRNAAKLNRLRRVAWWRRILRGQVKRKNVVAVATGDGQPGLARRHDAPGSSRREPTRLDLSCGVGRTHPRSPSRP